MTKNILMIIFALILIIGFTEVASAVITEDTHYDVPEVPFPGYLETFNDPVFGYPVTRIGDLDVFGTNEARHFYSKRDPWNCDGTYIILSFAGGTFLLNGGTYEYIKRLDLTYAEEPCWSTTDPHIIYYHKDNSIYTYNVLTDESTLIRTFSEYNKISMRWEGNWAADGDWVAYQGTGNGRNDFFTYQLSTNTVHGVWPLSTFGRTDCDWVSISPSGKYVLVNWGDPGSGTGEGVDLFDNKMNYIRKLTPEAEHADIGWDENGDDVYVTVTYMENVPRDLYAYWLKDSRKVRMVNLDWGGMHVSCRNLKQPGWALISYTTHISESPFHDEVFIVKMDGSEVKRIAHHHSTSREYRAEVHGVVNVWGDRVLFASDWGPNNAGTGSDGWYSYAVDLRENGITGTILGTVKDLFKEICQIVAKIISSIEDFLNPHF